MTPALPHWPLRGRCRDMWLPGSVWWLSAAHRPSGSTGGRGACFAPSAGTGDVCRFRFCDGRARRPPSHVLSAALYPAVGTEVTGQQLPSARRPGQAQRWPVAPGTLLAGRCLPTQGRALGVAPSSGSGRRAGAREAGRQDPGVGRPASRRSFRTGGPSARDAGAGAVSAGSGPSYRPRVSAAPASAA